MNTQQTKTYFHRGEGPPPPPPALEGLTGCSVLTLEGTAARGAGGAIVSAGNDG